MEIRSKCTMYINCENDKNIDLEVIEPVYIYKEGETVKAIIPANFEETFSPENSKQVTLIVKKVEHNLIGLSGIMDQDIYVTTEKKEE